MFEKEIEERFIKSYPQFCCNGKPLSPFWDIWEAGTDFAYNKAKVEVEDSYRESLCNSELNLASVTEQLEELEKANEWHYVSKGEMPTDEKTILIYLEARFVLGWYKFGFWYSNDGEIEEDVIAWKEIVLPELPKESV